MVSCTFCKLETDFLHGRHNVTMTSIKLRDVKLLQKKIVFALIICDGIHVGAWLCTLPNKRQTIYELQHKLLNTEHRVLGAYEFWAQKLYTLNELRPKWRWFVCDSHSNADADANAQKVEHEPTPRAKSYKKLRNSPIWPHQHWICQLFDTVWYRNCKMTKVETAINDLK